MQSRFRSKIGNFLDTKTDSPMKRELVTRRPFGGEFYFSVRWRPGRRFIRNLGLAVGQIRLFAAGRGALANLILERKPEVLYVPDYICGSIREVAQYCGVKVIALRVERDLILRLSDVRNVQPDSLTVVPHLFGVANIEALLVLKSQGAPVVSDVTHMLWAGESLERVAELSDFTFGSLRKFGPSIDGGFLASKLHSFGGAKDKSSWQLVITKMTAVVIKSLARATRVSSTSFLKISSQAESFFDKPEVWSSKISWLGKFLVSTIHDDGRQAKLESIVTMIRERLSGKVEFPRSNFTGAPYLLCVFDSNLQRELVREQLRAQEIFLPVHWPEANSESRLEDRTLSIPLNPFYSEVEYRSLLSIMEQVVNG